MPDVGIDIVKSSLINDGSTRRRCRPQACPSLHLAVITSVWKIVACLLNQGSNAIRIKLSVFTSQVDHTRSAQTISQFGKHYFVITVSDGHRRCDTLFTIERDRKTFQSQQGCTRVKLLQQLAAAKTSGNHEEVCREFFHVSRFYGLRFLQYCAL